jgi:hypothetical protein
VLLMMVIVKLLLILLRMVLLLHVKVISYSNSRDRSGRSVPGRRGKSIAPRRLQADIGRV